MGAVDKIDLFGLTLQIGAVEIGTAASNFSISSTELAFLDGVVAGTATASKALVLNGSKGIATITSATITTLTTTTVNASGVVTATGGVAAAGGFAVRPRLMHTGGIPAQISGDGTDRTPVATEVQIAEVFVPANTSVTGVAHFNGTVASGNIKVGLADSAGLVVATSASTAISGTDVYQRVPFTTPYAAVGPATYFVLTFVDNNTARVNTHTFGDFATALQTGQTYATGFTAITPPTTFTTAVGPIASLYA